MADVLTTKIERLESRVHSLQALSAALAAALSPERVAAAALQEGAQALEAVSGVLAVVSDEGTALQVVGLSGRPATEMEPFADLPLDAPVPLCEAVRNRTTVLVHSPAEAAARYPHFRSAIDAGRYVAWLVLPLVADGRSLGAVEYAFADALAVDGLDLGYGQAVADLCALALHRAVYHQAAQTAVRAGDEWLSLVSHDLKNPLATIKGYAQLLQRRAGRLPAEDGQRMLDGLTKIDQATARMASLIDELLDLNRLQTGRPLQLVPQWADLVALARQVAAELQAETDGHQILVEPGPAEVRGRWDVARLVRVLHSVMLNAIQYSPHGSDVHVQIAQEDGWAVLTVQDAGIGISATDLPHIFRRSYRGAQAATIRRGAGMGLFTAHELVRQHGGAISAASDEGHGCTITIRLPLQVAG